MTNDDDEGYATNDEDERFEDASDHFGAIVSDGSGHGGGASGGTTAYLQALEREVSELRSVVDNYQLLVSRLESELQTSDTARNGVLEQIALRYEDNARASYNSYARRLQALAQQQMQSRGGSGAGENVSDTVGLQKTLAALEQRLLALETLMQEKEKEERVKRRLALIQPNSQSSTSYWPAMLSLSLLGLGAVGLYWYWNRDAGPPPGGS